MSVIAAVCSGQPVKKRMPSVGDSTCAEQRKCAGCDKPASSLQCPKCLQLNILDSYFCDQDCFKRNWVTAIRLSLAN